MYLLFTVCGVGRNDFDANKSMSKTIGSGKSRLFGPKKVSIFQGPPLPTALEMEGGGAICKVRKIRLRYIKNLNCYADLITAAVVG